MANRGFPHCPGNEGKPGFPYQPVNGNYPGMYYPGAEVMGMPYGQYSGGADTQFNDHCATQQIHSGGGSNMSYGFGAHPYMQHYRQAHLMQAQAAAYCQQQVQGRGSNPQQIADSIYNMAAHAYNYQQQQTTQLQSVQSNYSPGAGPLQQQAPQHSALSVRTGQSPAGSMHSPAGSSHSMGGERPLLSPHIQANTQQAMYNYHQANRQQQQPQPSQNNINYYNGAVPTHDSHSSMNPNASLERLAAISNPDQFNNTQQQKMNAVSAADSSNNMVNNQYYPTPSTETMAAPYRRKSVHSTSTTSSGSTNNRKPQNKRKSSNTRAEGCVSASVSKVHNQVLTCQAPSVTQAPQTADNTGGITTNSVEAQEGSHCNPPTIEKPQQNNNNQPNNIDETVSLQPPNDGELLQEHNIKSAECQEPRPKETAVDSGIDSEQVDKDNDEEHDTSTSSKSDPGSPRQHKHLSSNSEGELANMTMADQGTKHAAASQVDENVGSNLAANDDKTGSTKAASPGDVNKLDSNDENSSTNPDDEEDANTPSPLCDQSCLNESFRSTSPHENISSSLSSSSASKKSMNDESRLPPRKRKQQLSEHTESPTVAMPPKKRGRPSKETIRLREAAKLAEATRLSAPSELTDDCVSAENLNIIAQDSGSIKERKSSVSKPKKPIHSGALLHSPKLSLDTKSNPLKNCQERTSLKETNSSLTPASMHNDTAGDETLLNTQPKSNAVLVSPPKKPKASVSEMQKALMRAVSCEGTEAAYQLKRKRGRPPGSKNKKGKDDTRARSNSNSSAAHKKVPVVQHNNAEQLAESVTCTKIAEPVAADCPVDPPSGGTTPKPQLPAARKLSSSVQNRAKSLHIRKSSSLSPKFTNASAELRLPVASDQWLCVFCQHISNYMDMGDLFGGYNLQSGTPLSAKALTNKKTSEQRQQVNDPVVRPHNEIWFHEKCIVWAPGVHMIGGKLYGVYDAITIAFQTTCSLCKKKGAILGCFCKGCPNRYHVHCAEITECSINEDNFSMLCPKHKNKKIVLV